MTKPTESIHLSTKETKEFAIYLGWQEQIMTTTESPNYLIDNPQSFEEFISEKYDSQFIDDIIEWKMKDAKDLADKKRANIQMELEQERYSIEESIKTSAKQKKI